MGYFNIPSPGGLRPRNRYDYEEDVLKKEAAEHGIYYLRDKKKPLQEKLAGLERIMHETSLKLAKKEIKYDVGVYGRVYAKNTHKPWTDGLVCGGLLGAAFGFYQSTLNNFENMVDFVSGFALLGSIGGAVYGGHMYYMLKVMRNYGKIGKKSTREKELITEYLNTEQKINQIDYVLEKIKDYGSPEKLINASHISINVETGTWVNGIKVDDNKK